MKVPLLIVSLTVVGTLSKLVFKMALFGKPAQPNCPALAHLLSLLAFARGYSRSQLGMAPYAVVISFLNACSFMPVFALAHMFSRRYAYLYDALQPSSHML